MKTAIKLSVYLTLFLNISAYAEVVTDGTMGAQHSLSGHMEIPQSLGTTVGNNLFHSFNIFNINTGESATFTGSNTLQNVISRVTGGNSSNINGLLKSEIGQANFYFINPAGVTFGANAQVDVPAAFHVSTAAALRFADGSLFNSAKGTASTLSIAEPIGFGFLNNQAGDIKVQGSLVFKDGSSVSVSANNVTLNQGKLTSAAGEIQLYAIGGKATKINLNTPTSNALAGNLTLNNAASVDVSGNGAGKVLIRSGDVNLYNKSSILANNYYILDASSDKGIAIVTEGMKVDHNSVVATDASHDGKAANLKIDVGGKLAVVNRGQITSNTYGKGEAGQVIINAKEILLDGQQDNYATIASDTNNDASGKAGSVIIKGEQLTVANGGQISSNSNSYGDAGAIDINVANIKVDGEEKGQGGLIISDTYKSNAKGGSINIIADKLAVLNGQISSNSHTAGKAGNITVNANEILLDGQKTGSAQITSDSFTSGKAGVINVSGEQLTIVRNGQISSDSHSQGDGGDIIIDFSKVLIDGRGASFAGILADTLNDNSENTNAKAGTISVTADQLTLLNNGQIGSKTDSDGDAGQIIVHAKNLLIDAQGGDFAGIISDAIKGKGNAGPIEITANNLTILNGGQISSNSREFSTGNAGNIQILAHNINLQNSSITTESFNNVNAGNIDFKFTHWLTMNSSDVTTKAYTANGKGTAISKGGNITIHESQLVFLQNSGFFTSANGVNSDGGNIRVAADMLVINTGGIQANAEGGTGGNINLNLQALILNGNRLILGGPQINWPFYQYSFGNNLIQAASETGIRGNINITAPQMNIAGSISGLDTSKLIFPTLEKNPCRDSSTIIASSLVRMGKGGLPVNELSEQNFIPPTAHFPSSDASSKADLPSSKISTADTIKPKDNRTCTVVSSN